MTTHLNQRTLNRYLDGDLGDSARRKVWRHLSDCARCDRRLQKEAALRDSLRAELAALNRRDARELSELLPGIIHEANQPAAQNLKRSVAVLIVVLVIVTMLPMLRQSDRSRALEPLVNVPRVTMTISEGQSRFATDETSTPISREISLKYASPVPPPQATVAASFEPSE